MGQGLLFDKLNCECEGVGGNFAFHQQPQTEGRASNM